MTEITDTRDSTERNDSDQMRFMIPRLPLAADSASVPPEEVDRRTLRHTNGHNPTEERYNNAQLLGELNRLVNAGPRNEASDDTESIPNVLLRNPALEEHLVKEKVLISISRSELYFLVDKAILKSCSSNRLRKYMASLKPTGAPIIYLPYEQNEEITFYIHWLKGTSTACDEMFSCNYKGEKHADFDGLLRFYTLGWRMQDNKFLNFIIDKWIDIQESNMFCGNLATRIYAELPRHSTLTRLYVETWAAVSDDNWIKHTQDGQEGPTDFFQDVCTVQSFLRRKYPQGVPKKLKTWIWRHRYYCGLPQKPASLNPRPNGAQQTSSTETGLPPAAAPRPNANGVQPPSLTGIQLPCRCRPVAATSQQPEDSQTQVEGQTDRRSARSRRPSSRQVEAEPMQQSRSPSPEEEPGVESSRDQEQSGADEEAPVPEEIAKRWTSDAARRHFSFK